MANPMISDNWADVLDPRFERIWNEEYEMHPDMIPMLYDMAPHNGRATQMYSGVSTIADFQQFQGTVTYQDQALGYDSTATFLEWVNGFALERKLRDDEQYGIWDDKPRALAASAYRTRQGHGARMFNNAFSVDTLFYTNSEGVALCSNSHTTTTGASTANGFDNLGTGSLTATEVRTNRIQMVNFRGMQAERIQVTPDTLLIPPNLYGEAFEIVQSPGNPENANNAANVHEGRYKIIEWNYLSDNNNWFMLDSSYARLMLKWIDRIDLEHGFVEDFDTFQLKYRAYMRYANLWRDWRFVMGNQVS